MLIKYLYILLNGMPSEEVNKILVATDGSEHARRALEIGLNFAEKFESEVLLIHVIPEPIVKDYALYPREGKEFDGSMEIITERKTLIEKEFQHAKEIKPNLKIEKKLVQGSISDRIIEISKSENIDLIVIGHRGLSLTSEILMGSTTRQVAQKTELPLLIVKK